MIENQSFLGPQERAFWKDDLELFQPPKDIVICLEQLLVFVDAEDKAHETLRDSMCEIFQLVQGQ